MSARKRKRLYHVTVVGQDLPHESLHSQALKSVGVVVDEYVHGVPECDVEKDYLLIERAYSPEQEQALQDHMWCLYVPWNARDTITELVARAYIAPLTLNGRKRKLQPTDDEILQVHALVLDGTPWKEALFAVKPEGWDKYRDATCAAQALYVAVTQDAPIVLFDDAVRKGVPVLPPVDAVKRVGRGTQVANLEAKIEDLRGQLDDATLEVQRLTQALNDMTEKYREEVAVNITCGPDQEGLAEAHCAGFDLAAKLVATGLLDEVVALRAASYGSYERRS